MILNNLSTEPKGSPANVGVGVVTRTRVLASLLSTLTDNCIEGHSGTINFYLGGWGGKLQRNVSYEGGGESRPRQCLGLWGEAGGRGLGSPWPG